MRPKINHLKKIKVAAVSYLNTKPLLYGIKHHPIIHEIELIEDYPSRIAQMLVENKADIGLIPVAAIPQLKEYYICTDYCIGADGAVASVCLFSNVPMEEITTVYLDYQSRTSVNLVRILLKEYWKKDVHFIYASGEDFRSEIKGTAAGVVIGDRALEQRSKSTYIYDLAAAWKTFTGLPFVFATWIANKKLPEAFIDAFNKANTLGLERLEEVIEGTPYSVFNLKEYYTRYVSYALTEEMQNGMSQFLKMLRSVEESSE